MEQNPLKLNNLEVRLTMSNYRVAKSIIQKRNKLQEKLLAIQEKYRKLAEQAMAKIQVDIDKCQADIDTIDNITLKATEASCGHALHSEQCMKIFENPEYYFTLFPEEKEQEAETEAEEQEENTYFETFTEA